MCQQINTSISHLDLCDCVQGGEISVIMEAISIKKKPVHYYQIQIKEISIQSEYHEAGVES